MIFNPFIISWSFLKQGTNIEKKPFSNRKTDR
jgi:hypothetical protein